MEPPAHPADSADPSAPDDPSTPDDERSKQPGKWALVRNLNQVLKTFAVMPVRPVAGGGGRAPGHHRGLSSWPRPQFTHPLGARRTAGSPSPRVRADGGLPVPRGVPDSLRELVPSCLSLGRKLLYSPRWTGQA